MAKQKALARVEVLPAEQEEQQLTKETVAAITEFMRGVVAFFRVGRELEKQAAATLDAAKTLKAPTDAASDTKLQKFIQGISDEEHGAGEHWDPICSTVFGFHRWLTGKRKPTLEYLGEAKKLAQPLHNSYVESERRRVAREAEEQRLANERQAQADRDKELQKLEDIALKAEAASADLSEREKLYVREYLGLLAQKYHGGESRACAVQAAIRAGYKNPEARALVLVAMPKIVNAVHEATKAAAAREQKTARAAQPLEVEDVKVGKMNVGTAGYDRTTWSGELLDEGALITGVIRGVVVAYTEALGQPINDARVDAALGIALKTSAIPTDILTVSPTQLNVYARKLHENLNRWPGCRAKKNTGTI